MECTPHELLDEISGLPIKMVENVLYPEVIAWNNKVFSCKYAKRDEYTKEWPVTAVTVLSYLGPEGVWKVLICPWLLQMIAEESLPVTYTTSAGKPTNRAQPAQIQERPVKKRPIAESFQKKLSEKSNVIDLISLPFLIAVMVSLSRISPTYIYIRY